MPHNAAPPSEVVASRIRELRERRGWTQQQMAERMTAYAQPTSQQTINKIERGRQRVHVDELIAFAFVLGVSPIALLVPTERRQLAMTSNTNTPSENAWAYYMGHLPMGGTLPGESHDWIEQEGYVRFYREAVPNHVATAEDRLPGIGALGALVADAAATAGRDAEWLPLAWPALEAILAEVIDQSSALRDRVHRAILGARKAAKS